MPSYTMKTKTIIIALLSAFLAAGSFAKGPKGGATRIDSYGRPQISFESNTKGAKVVRACTHCDAMTMQHAENDATAAAYCQVGSEITCSTCKTKLQVERISRPKPMGKVGLSRNSKYVSGHGENCLIVAEAVRN